MATLSALFWHKNPGPIIHRAAWDLQIDPKTYWADPELKYDWLRVNQSQPNSGEHQLWIAFLEQVIIDLQGHFSEGRWANHAPKDAIVIAAQARHYKSALAWVKRRDFTIGGLDWCADHILNVAATCLRKRLLIIAENRTCEIPLLTHHTVINRCNNSTTSEKRRKYQRQWRANHLQDVRERNREWMRRHRNGTH